MTGEDPKDPATIGKARDKNYWKELTSELPKGIRFGINKEFLEDSLYLQSMEKIASLGGIMIEFEPAKMNFDGFGELLSADMRRDLPAYLHQYASDTISAHRIEDIVAYNKADSTLRIPYGQGRFERILQTNLTNEELDTLRNKIRAAGKDYFETTMSSHNLDIILSINNRNAGHAAAANYPCLTIPMGYRADGQPAGITFISRPLQEELLLKIGYAYEQATKARKAPDAYP